MLTLESGHYFEERALFFSESRMMTAVASESTTLYTLDKQDFASLVEPGLRRFIQKRLKITHADVRLEDLVLIEKCA